MAISFLGSSDFTSGYSAVFYADKAAPGDVLIARLKGYDDPAGWAKAGVDDRGLTIYWRVVMPDERAEFPFPFDVYAGLEG